MIVKANAKKRVMLPGAKPGDVFDVELDDGKILLTKLVSAVSKLVRARRVNGIVMGSKEVELNSKVIVDAIRSDRK